MMRESEESNTSVCCLLTSPVPPTAHDRVHRIGQKKPVIESHIQHVPSYHLKLSPGRRNGSIEGRLSRETEPKFDLQVTIYQLLHKGTVEERIYMRAQQKLCLNEMVQPCPLS